MRPKYTRFRENTCGAWGTAVMIRTKLYRGISELKRVQFVMRRVQSSAKICQRHTADCDAGRLHVLRLPEEPGGCWSHFSFLRRCHDRGEVLKGLPENDSEVIATAFG